MSALRAEDAALIALAHALSCEHCNGGSWKQKRARRNHGHGRVEPLATVMFYRCAMCKPLRLLYEQLTGSEPPPKPRHATFRRRCDWVAEREVSR